MNVSSVKLLSACVGSAVLLMAASQNVFSHTRLSVPTTKESSSAHGTTTTAVNIPHGCGDSPVVGNVFFLPDTQDATVHTSDTDAFTTFDTVDGDNALNYIANPPFIRVIKSNDVFSVQDLILDPLNNPLGFWAAGGSLPAKNWVGQLPIQITAVAIKPESCATSVTFIASIANVCNVTPMSAINGANPDDPNADFWTAPGVGTPYDAPDWTYPATYKVKRDLENNPLPESCGAGTAVRIVPSAAQVNRDMPVKFEGQQVWPQP
ncbi:MAG: hypothetical protein H0V39_02870 [Nitrosomonas sp.]|nr:hypothetical protein [Nitrosomonas sp.]